VTLIINIVFSIFLCFVITSYVANLWKSFISRGKLWCQNGNIFSAHFFLHLEAKTLSIFTSPKKNVSHPNDYGWYFSFAFPPSGTATSTMSFPHEHQPVDATSQSLFGEQFSSSRTPYERRIPALSAPIQGMALFGKMSDSM